MSRRIVLLLALAAPAAGDDLADARRQLASKSADDRLAAVEKLASLDSRGAIEALAEVIKKSGVEMDRLGKKLDKADLDWGKAFDKRMALEARGKLGTEAHRALHRKSNALPQSRSAVSTNSASSRGFAATTSRAGRPNTLHSRSWSSSSTTSRSSTPRPRSSSRRCAR